MKKRAIIILGLCATATVLLLASPLWLSSFRLSDHNGEKVLRLATSASEEDQLHALQFIAERGISSNSSTLQLESVVARALNSPSSAIRLRAVIAIQRFSPEVVLLHLSESHADSDPEVWLEIQRARAEAIRKMEESDTAASSRSDKE